MRVLAAPGVVMDALGLVFARLPSFELAELVAAILFAAIRENHPGLTPHRIGPENRWLIFGPPVILCAMGRDCAQFLHRPPAIAQICPVSALINKRPGLA